MKNTIKNIFTYTLPFSCILCLSNENAVFSARRRAAQRSVLGQYARSNASIKNNANAKAGNTNPAFVTCGSNAQANVNGTSCECIDPTNYVINAANPNECIQKTTTAAIAQEKACGQAYIKAVENKCSNAIFNNGIGDDNLKCYSSNDLYLKLDTSNVIVIVDGTTFPYDKVCYTYSEKFANEASIDYQVEGENSPNCRRARAIATGSTACYQAVLAAGRATGAVDSIREKLESLCGASGLKATYAQLFGTDDAEKKGITFPSDLPNRYINTGKLSPAHGIELVGNYLDGKITDKSNEWERQILDVLNVDLALVGSYCGKEFEVARHDTSFQLSNEKSSLARAVDEGGSIKGASNWALGQLSTVLGENRVNKFKREGIVGGIKDEEDTNKSINTYAMTDDKELTSDNIANFFRNDSGKLKEVAITITADGKPAYHVFTRKDSYVIVKFTKDSTDNNKIAYEKIKYEDVKKETSLPASVLSEMVGRTEVEESKEIRGTLDKPNN